jgi:hypothetical protein
MTFESMGLLVYRSIAESLPLTSRSSWQVDSFKSCGASSNAIPWKSWLDQEHPSFSEWFEWLAKKCAEYKSTRAPAYDRGAGWKP